MKISIQTAAADILVSVCARCGALVHDEAKHETWHKLLLAAVGSPDK